MFCHIAAKFEKIEPAAFYRCYSLQEITIPDSVCSIGDEAFFRCSSLTSISVNNQNSYYCDIDGVLFNKDKTEMIAYPEGRKTESYIIPNSVKSLSRSPFGYRCRYLKKITIPSSVVEFPDYNMFVYPEDVTLLVEAGSEAEKYAKKQGLNYKLAEAESQLDGLHENLELPELTTGRYTYEKENIIDSAYLEIEENQAFTFNYSLLSSYIARGKYTVEGNEIHCKTDDGLYEYIFTVKDGTLVFNKHRSSKLPEFAKLSNLAVFK